MSQFQSFFFFLALIVALIVAALILTYIVSSLFDCVSKPTTLEKDTSVLAREADLDGLLISERKRIMMYLFRDGANRTRRQIVTEGCHDSCRVCFEDFKIGDRACQCPHCKHTFHRKCLMKWLENGSTCPLCNGQIISAVEFRQAAGTVIGLKRVTELSKLVDNERRFDGIELGAVGLDEQEFSA